MHRERLNDYVDLFRVVREEGEDERGGERGSTQDRMTGR